MWISVTLQAAARRAEALSEALLEQGALSVTLDDADAGTEREQPQFGEPGLGTPGLWQQSRIIALFDGELDSTELGQRLAAAATAVGLESLPPFTLEQIAEENWVQLTQSQFDPIRVTERLWIVPSWHEAPDANALNIELDPGMAFGTGSHPTTWLCLEWLDRTVTAAHSVLDYGCGSGILAIAAARLGARRVLGVDIDDKALIASRDNAARNGVRIELQHSAQPTGGMLDEHFDVVVANILTNPLCVLASLIAARVAPGGHLALAGILASQTEQVVQAYAPFIALRPGAVREGWVRLEGQRPA